VAETSGRDDRVDTTGGCGFDTVPAEVAGVRDKDLRGGCGVLEHLVEELGQLRAVGGS